MFIVMKDGPKKGEIQEMKYHVARDLINAGRAEQYFFEEAKVTSYSAQPEPVQPIAATQPPLLTKKKKK